MYCLKRRQREAQAYVGYRLAQNGKVSRVRDLSLSCITRFETRRIDTVLKIQKTDIRNEVTLLWLSHFLRAGVNRMPFESGIASEANASGNTEDMLTEAL